MLVSWAVPKGPSLNPAERWLLIKHRDEYADDSFDIQNPELDHSVLSGRTLDEIAGAKPTRKRKTKAE